MQIADKKSIHNTSQQATPLDCHAHMGSGNLRHLSGEIPWPFFDNHTFKMFQSNVWKNSGYCFVESMLEFNFSEFEFSFPLVHSINKDQAYLNSKVDSSSSFLELYCKIIFSSLRKSFMSRIPSSQSMSKSLFIRISSFPQLLTYFS